MPSELFTREFTVSEAAWAADVDVETLRSWLKRGKFEISTESGKWTRFSFVELCQVAVFAEILTSEGSHTLAQYIASGSHEHFSSMQSSYDNTRQNIEIYVLCGRDVDAGGNHIGGIIFHDMTDLTKRISSLLSSGIASFSVVSLSAVSTNVIKRLSSLEK